MKAFLIKEDLVSFQIFNFYSIEKQGHTFHKQCQKQNLSETERNRMKG